MATNTTEVDIIKIKTEPAEKSLKSLKTELKETRDRMAELRLSGQETSEAYQELSSRAGELSRAMQLATNDIKESSTTFTNTVSYVSGSLAGVSGAVQAATGALSLMGVEMGEDSKLMKALVSAMALTSGLTAVQSGVEAFKKLTTNIKRTTLAQHGLNAAMKANPVTFIVAGVAALTAAVIGFAKAVGKAREEQERLIDDANYARMQDAYTAMTDEMEIGIKMMKLHGATEYETFMQEKANWKKRRDEAEKTYYYYLKLSTDGNKQQRKLAEERLEELRKTLDEAQGMYNEYIKNTGVAEEQERIRLDKEREKAEKEAADKRKAASQQYAQQRQADLQRIAKIERDTEIAMMGKRDGELAKLKDTYDEQVKLYEKRGKDITNLTEYYNQQVKAINDRYDEEERKAAEAQAQAIAEAIAKGQAEQREQNESTVAEHQLDRDIDYYTKRKEIVESGEKDIQETIAKLELTRIEDEIAMLDEQHSLQLVSEKEYQAQRLALETEYSEMRIQIKQQEADRKKEIDRAAANAAIAITGELGGILGSLTEFMAEDSEAYKNIKAAQAIINTISGAVAAFMGITESTGGWGTALAIAKAAAVTAAGMAEVHKIYAVDTTGGKNTPSATTSLTATSALSQNYNNTRLVANGGGVYDLSQMNQQQNLRVYVLTQDIEESLNRVRVTANRNTF